MIPLRLSPSTNVIPTPAGVLLRTDLGTYQIEGADAGVFLTEIVPLLDGSRDRAAVEAVLGRYAPASVARFLDRLAERGLIEETEGEGSDDGRRGLAAFFRRCSLAPAEAMERLASARVVMAGEEPWGEVAAAALGAAGVGSIEPFGAGALDAGGLLLAAVSPDDAVLVEHIARTAHRAGVRALWSHLAEGRAILGPLTVPGRTACRICAAAEALNPPLGARPSPGARTGVMARLLGEMVAMEGIKLLSGYAPARLGGRVLVVDLTTFESRLHTLVRLPWCRVCGTGAVP